MNLQFTKATKEKARLRLAIFGTSGSGKTFTALRMATGMGGKVAVIDTERGSASKYADRFNFDVLELPSNDIETYIAAISAAQSAGYQILIIDSLSHAWQELLQEVDKIAKTRYKGNSWSAWSDGTPKQRKLVDSLLNYNGHIIATMRSKTEWTIADAGNGKSKPVRVGLAPEQGKGIEYEFDLLMEISVDHIAEITKDRTGKYQDQIIEKPGEDFGKSVINWLNDGAARKTNIPKVENSDHQDEQDDTASLQYQDGSSVAIGDSDKAKAEQEAFIDYCKAHDGNAPKNVFNLRAWLKNQSDN